MYSKFVQVRNKEMLNRIVFLLLFITSVSHAISIDGTTNNVVDGSLVQLVQYKFGEVAIAKTTVVAGKFSFQLVENSPDGVYSVVLSNETSNYTFDLIIDRCETVIKVSIDPLKEESLVIVESKINANYYDFLKAENFKIAVVNHVMAAMNSANKSVLNSSDSLKYILDNEVNELRELRLNYIKSNFNKWSTELVKNSISVLLYENVTRENFWSFFSTQNTDLINSPIFQKLIQEYVINYYKIATEDDYKVAFNEVIIQFSHSNVTKEWVVKYIINGLNQLGNKDLVDFFSKKYSVRYYVSGN